MQKEKYKASMIKYLPTLRASSGLTQQQLAKIVGISRQTLVAVETGKRPLNWSIYLALVLVFSFDEKAKLIMETFEVFNESEFKNL